MVWGLGRCVVVSHYWPMIDTVCFPFTFLPQKHFNFNFMFRENTIFPAPINNIDYNSFFFLHFNTFFLWLLNFFYLVLILYYVFIRI